MLVWAGTAFKDRLRTGVLVGIAMASMYSAWILLLYAVGRRATQPSDISIQGAILAYYSAGIMGGALVGAMLPIGRSWAGMVTLGAVTALTFFFCVEVALMGPFWLWRSEVWREIGVLALLIGVPGGIVVKLQSRRW